MSKRRCVPIALLLAIALILAGCTGTTDPSKKSGKAVAGGTALYALGNQKPDFIFPFIDIAHYTTTNVEHFQNLMYRPLYWVGKGAVPVVDESRSLAELPTWSADGRTAVIKLKKWAWSDGTQLSARNVAFWMGLLESEKTRFAQYSPGAFPDNLSGVTFDDTAGTVTFTLNRPVSQQLFVANQLSLIKPLPLAWDLTGSGQQGTCSSLNQQERADSCPAVYKYLLQENKNVARYADNPLWKVVDGPWTLDAFSASGRATFVRNAKYSGPSKPTGIEKFVLQTFTSEDAEYNVLRSSNQIAVGYLPSQNLPKATGDGKAPASPIAQYVVAQDWTWGLSYNVINFNNPSVGPLFRQLYIRQAMQSALNQDVGVRVAYNGLAYASAGPIPLKPDSPYVPTSEKKAPYPFSIERARTYLTDNGWTIPTSGPATCSTPGTGPGQCGAGIPAGKQLKIKFEHYSSESTPLGQILLQYKTDAGTAGIEFDLKREPVSQVVSNAVPCKPSEATCNWELISYGGSHYTGAVPVGDQFFQTGGGQNVGSYSDPKMDTLITSSLRSADPNAFLSYANYATEQLPVIYMPNEGSATAVRADLRGATPLNPLGALTPEDWYFVK